MKLIYFAEAGRHVNLAANVIFHCLFSYVVCNAFSSRCDIRTAAMSEIIIVCLGITPYFSGTWHVQFARDILHHHVYNYIKSITLNVYFYIFNLTNY